MKFAIELLKLLPGWIAAGVRIAKAVRDQDPPTVEDVLRDDPAVRRVRERARRRKSLSR